MASIKYTERYEIGNNIIGSPGLGFNNPIKSMVFNNKNNYFYVINDYYKVVQVFNQAFVFQFSFSTIFNNPVGIVCDSYNYVYISDKTDNTIYKYNQDGILIYSFGGYGTMDGKFDEIGKLAIDSSDNIYAIDIVNKRIQKFDSDGVFLSKIEHAQFNTPNGIAVNTLNEVYVLDKLENCVFIFNPNGTFKISFGTYGSEDGEFDAPEDISIDISNKVYITEYTNSRVQVFNNYNVFLFKLNSISSIDGYNIDIPDNFYAICLDVHYNLFLATNSIDNAIYNIRFIREESIDNYISSLIRIFPYGPAWASKFYKSANMYLSFIKSVAYSIRDLDNRIKALLTSINLYKSTDYLSEWEKLLGLPKEDFDIADSIEQRKLNVLALIRASKAYTLQDWKDIALIMDTEIDVISYLDSYYRSFPFTFNIMFPIGNASEKPYYYYVIFKNTTASGSELSLPYTLPVTLSTSKYQYLEKIYNLIKPAYIKLIFKYE